MTAVAGASPLTRRQEMGAVALLSLGFGLVGIDRFLITTLFPVIAQDLHLSYSDIGAITGSLALAWGISALFMGNLSDRIGRRRVLTISLIAFSLLIGASGLAAGLVSLIVVRVVMGFADGAYTPVSIAATMAASAPHRRGFNIGIQQMMMPLFGLGLAPLFVAGALRYLEWRYIFLVFVLPGLLLSFGMWKVVPTRNGGEPPAHSGFGKDWRTALSYSNVRVAALLMLCWLTILVTTSAFMPNYLVDHRHIPLSLMSGIMSAIGLGATVGTLLLPWASDKLGRKAIMALSSLGALAALLLLANARNSAVLLFTFLFLVHFFNNALITLTVGPLCSEAVPAALMATASGLVIAVGELFGGGLMPFIVGHVAQRLGIDHILWLPIAGAVAGFLLCLAIRDVTQPTLSHQGLTT
jgi:predicted MFS family arabinose efflux permease